ncbi:hypothetical protein [Parvibaculum sp.]|uniref:hypothetical protein n=1 Tax=Parvibaculum sp. TaxID=2024848 RepID=UPI003298B38F
MLAALLGVLAAAFAGEGFASCLATGSFFFGAGLAGAAFAFGLAADFFAAVAGFAVLAAGFFAVAGFAVAGFAVLAAVFGAAFAFVAVLDLDFAGADFVALVVALAALARALAGFAPVFDFAGADFDLGALVILLAIVFPIPSLSRFRRPERAECPLPGSVIHVRSDASLTVEPSTDLAAGSYSSSFSHRTRRPALMVAPVPCRKVPEPDFR